MKALIVLLWLVTMLSTCLGGYLLFGALFAGAAPAQAAGAAVAVGFAVIPYVFTRSIEGMADK